MRLPALNPKTVYALANLAYTAETYSSSQLLGTLKQELGYCISKTAFAILNGSTGNYLPLYGGMGFIVRLAGPRRGEIVIATRGTANPSDIETDVNTPSARSPTGHLVHGGFLQTFKSYQEQLRSLLSHNNLGFRPTAIHCVGHSLGGALANLNAAACAELGFNVYLYTIAAPRVGKEPFAEHLSQKLVDEQVFRVANSSDPVTMLPCFPFVHAPYTHGHYLLEGGTRIDRHQHSMDIGYVRMTTQSWEQIQTTSLSIQARLDFQIKQAMQQTSGQQYLDFMTVISPWMRNSPVYSERLFRRVACLLNMILKELGLGRLISVTYFSTGAFSVVDQLSEILYRAANLHSSIESKLKACISMLDRFLGRVQRSAIDLSVALIREVLHMLSMTLSQMAQQAIAQNLRR